MTITSKAMAKVAVVATGLAMATSILSLAPIAHAQTTTTTTTTTACSVGVVNLTVGSRGSAVICLQQGLIARGYSIPAGATGYFGLQTRAAVAAWQAAAGVSPTYGYFGPISRAAWGLSVAGSMTTTTTSTVAGCVPGAMFSSTTGQSCTTTSTVSGCMPGAMFSSTTGQSCSGSTTTTTTTSGPLTGNGRLINVTSLGDVTSDVKEGAGPTSVIGFSADATGGDVAVQRVDATFVVSNVGSQSSNLDQYVSSVDLYYGSTKIASMNPSLADKSTRTWTVRFSGLNAVIRSGTTGMFHVKVTPLSSIGTNEDGKTVTAELLVDSVRAVGADGISDTYVATQINQAFTVSSSNVGTLTVTAAGDNPTASQIAVSSSTLTGVKLLSFNMKAKNQDVKITDLAITLGTSDSLSDVVNTVYLMKGSTILKSKTVGSGTWATTTFTSVNETISKDQTNTYSIVVDLKGDAAYPDGTTLSASTTVLGWDASDSTGASVSPSAAAAGNVQTLTASGISVVRGTPTATVNSANYTGGNDTANFTIPFTVTAGDSDVFLAGAVQKSTANNSGKVSYGTTTTSTQGATQEPTASLSAASTVTGDLAGVYYKVLAGTSRTFTLNVAIVASSTASSGYVGVQINSIAYGATSGALTSYYTSNLDTFKTNDVFVQRH